VAKDRNFLKDMLAESLGAAILGGGGGVLLAVLFWYKEQTGWSRRLTIGDWHLLPESMRASWAVFGLIVVGFALIGATVAVLINLRRRTTPWKRSWDKRGDVHKRNRR
jgi:hypothetical protein